MLKEQIKINMKYIIYHRYPSFQSKEEVDVMLKLLDGYVLKLQYDAKTSYGAEIIIEEANNLLTQQYLGKLIVRLKKEESTPETTTIIFYDLISLIGDNILVAISQLTELNKLATIQPYAVCNSIDLFLLHHIVNDYNEKRKIEKGKLLAFRLAKNGISYGRPTISVDIDKATKLRSEGLSYQEISDRMGQSLSLIYSKLPKEVKVKYRKLRYERVGRPRKQI